VRAGKDVKNGGRYNKEEKLIPRREKAAKTGGGDQGKDLEKNKEHGAK